MITITSININSIKSEYKKQSSKNINFCSAQSLGKDIFTRSTKKLALKIFNPFTQSYSEGEIISALDKPQIFDLKNNSRKIYNGVHLNVDYDPNRTALLFDKENKQPIETRILKTTDNANSIGYNFMSKDLQEEYGYLHFTVYKDSKTKPMAFEELLEDRPEQGIVGPKIVVEYVQNWYSEKIGGIGRLADKLIVKYCLENNLPINIVSVADRGSHMAHYLRGKRFFPIEEGSYLWRYYEEKFGTADINKMLEENKPQKNRHEIVRLDLGFLPMYMPKNLADKYARELLSEGQIAPKSY